MARTAAVKQIRFTDKYISGLKPEAARYFRREARGFAIRVMPTGLKTWFYIYTWKGSRKHMNLGVYNGITLAKARELYTAASHCINKASTQAPTRMQNSQQITPSGTLRSYTKHGHSLSTPLVTTQLSSTHYLSTSCRTGLT